MLNSKQILFYLLHIKRLLGRVSVRVVRRIAYRCFPLRKTQLVIRLRDIWFFKNLYESQLAIFLVQRFKTQ